MTRNLKIPAVILVLFFSVSAMACPVLEGSYINCSSKNKKKEKEYLIEERFDGAVKVYNVHFYDDESEEMKNITVRTDGSKDSRKETIPKYGITVRIDSISKCINEKVETISNGYVLGAKVGSFVTTMYRDGVKLHYNINGSYLNRKIDKRIICEVK